MQKTHRIFAALIILPALGVGCHGVSGNGPAELPVTSSPGSPHTTPADGFEAGEPDDLTTEASEDTQPPRDAPQDAPGGPRGFRGTVVETVTTGPYTYIHVDTGREQVWVAAPRFKIAVGDVVDVPAGMIMKDFRSKSLQRTFDLIFFVASVSTLGEAATSDKEAAPPPTGHPPRPGAEPAKPSLPDGHPPLPGAEAEPAKPSLPDGHPPLPGAEAEPAQSTADDAPLPEDEGEKVSLPPGHPPLPGPGQGVDEPTRKPIDPSEIDLSDIEKAEGGVTVEEVFARKGDLAGKSILLRGKVVKFNANILRTNWLHVKDGSGAPGTNDLVVTTSQTVQVGDTVLIKGTVAVDRDFGAGYKYQVLIENATATVE